MSTAGCTRRVPNRLILMRHAKSDYPVGVADHDRPLNARGRRDADAAAAWLLAHRDAIVSGELSVLVSSAVRAQQTWERAGKGLEGEVTVRTEPRIYEASVGTLLELAADTRAGSVLLLGHNPGLESALGHLLDAPHTMKTSAIAALALDPADPMAPGSARCLRVGLPRG